MGVAGPADSTDAAGAKLIDGLFRRNAELEVPSPKKYGISEQKYFDAIPTMAAQALASGSPQNNPRVPTADEIIELYKEIWE
jgi:alcohol dehydrogenase class IV